MKPTRKQWAFIWGVPAGFILVWFAVFETIAITNGTKGDTLSEQVWWILSSPFAVPFAVLYFGIGIWATVHFFKKYKGW
jgi:hypothetical protein